MGVNLTGAPIPGVSRSPSGLWLRRAAVASLVVNIGIVVTGGVVRLTGSGLGCPTWPRCTDESFVPHQAMGLHSAIEFGNRMLTFVVAAVAIVTFLLAWRHGRASVLRLSLLLALGVPAQAVIGGITVLTDLNSWVVSLHLLVSLAMVALAVTLCRRLGEGDGPPQPSVPVGTFRLSRAVLLAGWAVLYVGTVVTGSGPHAGDASAPRNGLDPRALSQLHADLVFLLLGLTVAAVLVLRTGEVPALARRAAVTLLLVELAQGLVGFVQYFTDLPVVLVACHLLGAALVSAAMTWLAVSVRTRERLTAMGSTTGVPAGSVPAGLDPTGSGPGGSVPAGLDPTGSGPGGSVPTRSTSATVQTGSTSVRS